MIAFTPFSAHVISTSYTSFTRLIVVTTTISAFNPFSSFLKSAALLIATPTGSPPILSLTSLPMIAGFISYAPTSFTPLLSAYFIQILPILPQPNCTTLTFLSICFSPFYHLLFSVLPIIASCVSLCRSTKNALYPATLTSRFG